jgi:hypothetical protein
MDARGVSEILLRQEANAKTYSRRNNPNWRFIEIVYNYERLPPALGKKPLVELEADPSRSRNPKPNQQTKPLVICLDSRFVI